MAYQIFTDATADLSGSLAEGIPPVEIIPMRVDVAGQTYTYGPEGDLTPAWFYDMQRKGWFAATSQINPSVYFERFEPYLRRGTDILYLCFSSGMSGTIQSALLCMEELKRAHPMREIVCIDTLCASVGEGFLVREAAKKQQEGLGLDKLARWIMEHRLQVCHWFTVDIFDHLRHGGRVSSAAAVMGTALKIKPLLHVDEQGCLQVVEKPRGDKKAMAALLARMEQGWSPKLGESVVVGHGGSPEAAASLARQVAARFPRAEIHVTDIGPVIGAHTGPGMLAFFRLFRTRPARTDQANFTPHTKPPAAAGGS